MRCQAIQIHNILNESEKMIEFMQTDKSQKYIEQIATNQWINIIESIFNPKNKYNIQCSTHYHIITIDFQGIQNYPLFILQITINIELTYFLLLIIIIFRRTIFISKTIIFSLSFNLLFVINIIILLITKCPQTEVQLLYSTLVNPDLIKPVTIRLARLTTPEIYQWADILFQKLLALEKSNHLKKLKQVLTLYIVGCHKYKIQNQVNEIEKLLVMIYIRQNPEKFSKMLKQSGFPVQSETTLVYEESILTKLYYAVKDVWI